MGDLSGSIVSQLKSPKKIVSFEIVVAASKIEQVHVSTDFWDVRRSVDANDSNQDLFILTFNNMDSVRKLDLSILKRVMTRKQMSFSMKIIIPPP